MAPWSKTRKILEEECLCEALRGRVRYFVTRYRHAHDGRGRASVEVDGTEVINMPFVNEYRINLEAHKWTADSEKSLFDALPEVEKEFADERKFEPGDFGFAIEEYLGQSISKSLASPNHLVRMLAILDRRVGKRTLTKQKALLAQQPQWLQFFYTLRLECEGL